MDVRIISSCNEDPFRAIADNQFRKDLFYRLSTVMIELPPLREHKEDLEELIRYRLDATAFQYVHSFSGISPEVMEIFRSYSWPGNVRELFHVLDYAQNVADGETLRREHLPGYLRKFGEESRGVQTFQPAGEDKASGFMPGVELQSIMDAYEHKVLQKALEHYGYSSFQRSRGKSFTDWLYLA